VPIASGRRAVIRLDGTEYREVFGAPPAALRALETFRTAGGDPP
jgi:hypothetical protein